MELMNFLCSIIFYIIEMCVPICHSMLLSARQLHESHCTISR